MRQVDPKIVFVMVAGAMLSACSSQHSMRNAVDKTNSAPAVVSLAPLQYSWNTSYSAMLSPPMDIREQALAACGQLVATCRARHVPRRRAPSTICRAVESHPGAGTTS